MTGDVIYKNPLKRKSCATLRCEDQHNLGLGMGWWFVIFLLCPIKKKIEPCLYFQLCTLLLVGLEKHANGLDMVTYIPQACSNLWLARSSHSRTPIHTVKLDSEIVAGILAASSFTYHSSAFFFLLYYFSNSDSSSIRLAPSSSP